MAHAALSPYRRRAGKLGLLLALALVFAQLGAVTHGYAHLRPVGAAQGMPAKVSHGCPDCQSFAPLLASAGASSHALTLTPLQAQAIYHSFSAPLRGQAPQLAFRSRAPPLPA
jgi:hypothetical protein